MSLRTAVDKTAIEKVDEELSKMDPEDAFTAAMSEIGISQIERVEIAMNFTLACFIGVVKVQNDAIYDWQKITVSTAQSGWNQYRLWLGLETED